MEHPTRCDTTFYLHEDARYPAVPVQATLAWDVFDPMAVKVEFHSSRRGIADVWWWFSREALAAGLITPTGCGDVQVHPAVDGWMRIVLDSPSGHAEFTTLAEPIETFLTESFRRCPDGSEYRWLDVDQALAQLLEREAA